jgi:hypothetical protein
MKLEYNFSTIYFSRPHWHIIVWSPPGHSNSCILRNYSQSMRKRIVLVHNIFDGGFVRVLGDYYRLLVNEGVWVNTDKLLKVVPPVRTLAPHWPQLPGEAQSAWKQKNAGGTGYVTVGCHIIPNMLSTPWQTTDTRLLKVFQTLDHLRISSDRGFQLARSYQHTVGACDDGEKSGGAVYATIGTIPVYVTALIEEDYVTVGWGVRKDTPGKGTRTRSIGRIWVNQFLLFITKNKARAKENTCIWVSV